MVRRRDSWRLSLPSAYPQPQPSGIPCDPFSLRPYDYVTKPFHKDELLARVQAVVRRSQGPTEAVVRCGDLVVNVDAKRAEIAGQPVPLTGKEYQMLELLALRKGMTISKDMFLSHLYGGMDEPELKIIDVFMCKLRKKLAAVSGGTDYIETVWGRGYMLREPHSLREAG